MEDVSNPIIIDQFYCDSPNACQNQVKRKITINLLNPEMDSLATSTKNIYIYKSNTKYFLFSFIIDISCANKSNHVPEHQWDLKERKSHEICMQRHGSMQKHNPEQHQP